MYFPFAFACPQQNHHFHFRSNANVVDVSGVSFLCQCVYFLQVLRTPICTGFASANFCRGTECPSRMDQAEWIFQRNCHHYAPCRIDFLGLAVEFSVCACVCLKRRKNQGGGPFQVPQKKIYVIEDDSINRNRTTLSMVMMMMSCFFGGGFRTYFLPLHPWLVFDFVACNKKKNSLSILRLDMKNCVQLYRIGY